jgi:hypothetical protein
MGNEPQARPLFRSAAWVVAIFCFIAAIAFAWSSMDAKAVGIESTLFVGVVMATIAATGYWPRRSKPS